MSIQSCRVPDRFLPVRTKDTADATIAPSHIVFSFKGEEADGNSMNPKYDQFMGFSGSF